MRPNYWCHLSLQTLDHKKHQVLERVDLFDLVSEHVTLRRSGRRWVGLCPFHAEKTPSFTVNSDLGLFKCFGCGKGGDIFSFVQARENVDFMDAFRILGDRAGIDITSTGDGAGGAVRRADVARINGWVVDFFRAALTDESGRSALEYVRERGFGEDACREFGVGLAIGDVSALQRAASKAGLSEAQLLAADILRKDDNGRVYATFRNRLMFPIRDVSARVLGFGGRTLVDDRAKYLNTRQNVLFDKSHCLFGIDRARDSLIERKRCVIVEGYTDCMAAHQVGFAETVATLGTALTEHHINMLRRYCDEIILLFDSDRAGIAAAERAIAIAVPRCIRVRMARIPDGLDPSDFIGQGGGTGFSDVLNGAIDALEFKWCETVAKYDGTASDTNRRDAVLEFLGVVSQAVSTGAVDAIQRGLLVNQVAHLLRIERRDVDRLLKKQNNRSVRTEQRTDSGESDHLVSVPLDSEQAGWISLLELGLSEPGVLASREELPDYARIADTRDRRIAQVVFELIDEIGEFHLADVLARCTDPQDAERVTELAHRGASMQGKYEERLNVALERIRRGAADLCELAERKQRLLNAQGGSTEQRDQLAAINKAVMAPTGFAARRLKPKVTVGIGTSALIDSSDPKVTEQA